MAQKSYNAAVMFTLSAQNYQQGAQQIVSANKQITTSTAQMGAQTAKAGNSMGKATSVISQLGYGLEDFALGFQTGGMQGAMRGASNNMSAMAMAAGGLYGALAALGVVVGVTVLPALSKMAQYSEVFSGLKKSVEGFVDDMQAKTFETQLKRANEDAVEIFDSLRDIDSMVDFISKKRLFNTRSREDLATARKDLLAMVALRRELIMADYESGKSKNILQRGIAGVSPVAQNMMEAAMGYDFTNLYNNEFEIKKAFDDVQRQITQRVTKLKSQLGAGESLMEIIIGKTPENMAKSLLDNAREIQSEIRDQMLENSSLELQMQAELAKIREKYHNLNNDVELAAYANGESPEPMLEQNRRNQADEESMVYGEFNQKIADREAENLKRVQALQDKIAKFEDPLLEPIEQALRSISEEAKKLREEIENSAMSRSEKLNAMDQVDALEQQRKAKAEEGVKKTRDTSGQQLGAMLAGSDSVLAHLADRKDEKEYLKTIAKNTGKKSNLTIEVV